MAKKRARRKGAGDGDVFVDSRTYGPHNRAKRGTHKPAVLNDGMKASQSHLKLAAAYGRLIRGPIESFRGGFLLGQFWQQLQSALRRQFKLHQNWEPDGLKRMEVNKLHPLMRLCKGTFSFYSKAEQGHLHFIFNFDPPIFRSASINGFSLQAAVIFPNYEELTTHAELIINEMISLPRAKASRFEVLKGSVEIPENARRFLVVMKVEGLENGRPYSTQSSKGMAIVDAGTI